MKMSKIVKLLKTMGMLAVGFLILSFILWAAFGFQAGFRIGCRQEQEVTR